MTEQNWTRDPIKLAPYERDPTNGQVHELIADMIVPRDSMSDALRAAAIICASDLSEWGFPNVSTWHIETEVDEDDFFVTYIPLAMAEDGRLFTAFMHANFDTEEAADDFIHRLLNDSEFVHETVAEEAALNMVEKHFVSCPISQAA